jgi:FxLD family lantipeptide
MTPAVLNLAPDALAPAAADDDFVLDMRVVESITPLVTMMCDTSDNCGSTCENSACASGSNDPF